MTYSGQRTRVAGVWDGRVEALFRRLGGVALQQTLGYAASR